MATLSYRDPGTGVWVEYEPPMGEAGLQGLPGPIGPTAVSVDAGNGAIINPADGGIYFVPVTQAETDLLYVKTTGGVMTGALILPDQVFTPPTGPAVATAKGYVDQLVTASSDNPSGDPARDGLLWMVVGEALPGYDSFVTLYDEAIYDAEVVL